MQIILSEKEKKFAKFVGLTAIIWFFIYKMDKDK